MLYTRVLDSSVARLFVERAAGLGVAVRRAGVVCVDIGMAAGAWSGPVVDAGLQAREGTP